MPIHEGQHAERAKQLEKLRRDYEEHWRAVRAERARQMEIQAAAPKSPPNDGASDRKAPAPPDSVGGPVWCGGRWYERCDDLLAVRLVPGDSSSVGVWTGPSMDRSRHRMVPIADLMLIGDVVYLARKRE